MKLKFKAKKIYLKICALTLSLILLAGIGASAIDYENHWARDIFDEWITLGILQPDVNGNIRPNDPIVRGQLCSYINRIMGFVAGADMTEYTDTPVSDKYYRDMSAALSIGYIAPTSTTTLSPNKAMTREEVIDLFAKVARLEPKPEDMGILAGVRDAMGINPAYSSVVASAVANGFIAGRADFKMQPKDTMTISETIVLLDRLNSSKRAYGFPGIYGPASGVVNSNYSSIMAGNTTLQNADIAQDLDIHSNTAEGDVNLSNVKVGQKFLVNGGRNIYMKKVTVPNIEINKKSAHLVYAADNANDVDTLVINADNVIVDINKGNKTKNIIINGKNVTVNIGENVKIDYLENNGENAIINLAKGARINDVMLNAKTNIRGPGTIGKITINPGAGGSNVEPRPDEIIIDKDTDASINGKPAESSKPKVEAVTFSSPTALKVTIEDPLKVNITKADFKLYVDGTERKDFAWSKVSATEYTITLPGQPAESTIARVVGVNNLSGEATADPSSQTKITSGLPLNLNTVNVKLQNPNGFAFGTDNFKVEVNGKVDPKFTLMPQSSDSYDIKLSVKAKSGQPIVITGQKDLTGSVTMGLIATVKSIVFVDPTRFFVNTDDTTGNKIDEESFKVSVGGNETTNFKVTEKSKTQFEIDLNGLKMEEGKDVRVTGQKYLSGSQMASYRSPFDVSKVATQSKTKINVVLKKAPAITLNTEQHADCFQVILNDERIQVTDVKRDPTDTKGAAYILTVNMDKKQGLLTVNNIKEGKNKGIVDFVSPELMPVRINDKPLKAEKQDFATEQIYAKLIIEFSEPIMKSETGGKISKISAKDVALSGAPFSIISASGTGFDVKGLKLSLAGNAVVIDLSPCKVMDPGWYTLTVDTAQLVDSFGNACLATAVAASPGAGNEKKYNYVFQITGTTPTLVSAKQNVTGDLEIKISGNSADAFGKAMEAGSGTWGNDYVGGSVEIFDGTKQVGQTATYQFISYDQKAKTITIAKKPETYEDNNLNSNYRLVFSHPSFAKDFLVPKITIDTIKPRIIAVSFKAKNMTLKEMLLMTDEDKYSINSSNAIVTIEFSEPVLEKGTKKKLTVKNFEYGIGGIPFGIVAASGDTMNADPKKAKLTASDKIVTLNLSTAVKPDEFSMSVYCDGICDTVGNSVDTQYFGNLETLKDAEGNILKDADGKDKKGYQEFDTTASIKIYKFKVLGPTPPIKSAQQSDSTGDITVFFGNSHFIDYANEMVNGGRIMFKDNTGRYLAQDGTPLTDEMINEGLEPFFVHYEYLEAHNGGIYSSSKIVIKYAGLPPNLNGNFKIIFDDDYYELRETALTKIVSTDPRTCIIYLKDLAYQALDIDPSHMRVTPDEANVMIKFGTAIKELDRGSLTLNYANPDEFALNANITLEYENAENTTVKTPIELPTEEQAEIKVNFDRTKPEFVNVDLTKVLQKYVPDPDSPVAGQTNPRLIIEIDVYLKKVMNANNTPINLGKVYAKFTVVKLSTKEFIIESAEQELANVTSNPSGLKIVFYTANLNEQQMVDLNHYGSYIDGTNPGDPTMLIYSNAGDKPLIGTVPLKSEYTSYALNDKTLTIKKDAYNEIIYALKNPGDPSLGYFSADDLDNINVTLVLQHPRYSNLSTAPKTVTSGEPPTTESKPATPATPATLDLCAPRQNTIEVDTTTNNSPNIEVKVNFTDGSNLDVADYECVVKKTDGTLLVETIDNQNQIYTVTIAENGLVTISINISSSDLRQADLVIEKLVIKDVYGNTTTLENIVLLDRNQIVKFTGSITPDVGFLADSFNFAQNATDKEKLTFGETVNFSNYFDSSRCLIMNTEVNGAVIAQITAATSNTNIAELPLTAKVIIPDGVTSYRYCKVADKDTSVLAFSSAIDVNPANPPAAPEQSISFDITEKVKISKVPNGETAVKYLAAAIEPSTNYYVLEWTNANDSVVYEYIEFKVGS